MIDKDPVLKPLADAPAYQEAMTASPGPVVTAANPHLVNPIP